MNLFDYTELINDKPIHIATINSNNNPNLSVASDVRVIDKNKIIISVNEMNNTQKNMDFCTNKITGRYPMEGYI